MVGLGRSERTDAVKCGKYIDMLKIPSEIPPANLKNYHFQDTIHVTLPPNLLEARVSDFPVIHLGSVYMLLHMGKILQWVKNK